MRHTRPRLLLLLWSLVLLSLAIRLHVVLTIDNIGGVIAIGLKRTPSAAYRRFVSTEQFTAEGNFVLATGNENAVVGFDTIEWHAEIGCWLIVCGAVLGSIAMGRRSSRRRSATRP